MRIIVAIALSATLVTGAAAQRGGFSGGHIAGSGLSAGGSRGSASAARAPLRGLAQPRGEFAFGRTDYGSRYGPYGSFLWPLFGDYDLYASGYPVASQPPMIPLPEALAMMRSESREGAAEPDRSFAPAEPLIIELHGNNYVRVNRTPAIGEAQSIAGESNLSPDTTDSSSTAHTTSSSRAPELPPAVLIFRDGHSEQVRDYTIADGVLYARGDFYIDGYWNKQIKLASLDLPQTLQANASRNVNFALPSSPNEVIARF